MRRIKDLRGRMFGRWTVLDAGPIKVVRKLAWLCRCQCGIEKEVNGASLRRGLSKSCGCLQREITAVRNFKHGCHGTPEHNSWKHMLRRCLDPNNNRYLRYGARGISVCEEWLDFNNFLRDMGPKPTPRFTIDRIDSDKGYFPANCQWADFRTQARNRRNNVVLEVAGDRRTMAEWCEVAGINIQTLWARIARGWPPKKAIFDPVRVLNKVLLKSK